MRTACLRSFMFSTRQFSTTQGAFSSDDKLVKIGFVGAGGVSFGTKEGPWNHSVRLEKMPNLAFTAIVDPNLDLAQVLPQCTSQK